MKNETRTRVMKGVAVLALSFVLANPGEVYAQDIPKSKQGKFLESTYSLNDESEEVAYGRYVVKEGDNTSRISQKITRHFGVEMTTKYWPVVAFLNGFPRVINPGDVIIFPSSFEEMDDLYKSLRETGWLARYIQKNDIYGRREGNSGKTTLGQLLREIYGDSVCVDPDFVAKYLKAQGLSGKYDIDSIVDGNTDVLFELTDWIPTLDELNAKSKNKVRK